MTVELSEEVTLNDPLIEFVEERVELVDTEGVRDGDTVADEHPEKLVLIDCVSEDVCEAELVDAADTVFFDEGGALSVAHALRQPDVVLVSDEVTEGLRQFDDVELRDEETELVIEGVRIALPEEQPDCVRVRMDVAEEVTTAEADHVIFSVTLAVSEGIDGFCETV